jgi:hypothetical protein
MRDQAQRIDNASNAMRGLFGYKHGGKIICCKDIMPKAKARGGMKKGGRVPKKALGGDIAKWANQMSGAGLDPHLADMLGNLGEYGVRKFLKRGGPAQPMPGVAHKKMIGGMLGNLIGGLAGGKEGANIGHQIGSIGDAIFPFLKRGGVAKQVSAHTVF